uniref:Transmembrane protein 222 n=1 Tax=Mesocestoides corti TaxID=53468 RepID=A0A5K3FR92_MESCO
MPLTRNPIDFHTPLCGLLFLSSRTSGILVFQYLLRWLFPLIGHTGITNSKGLIYDFAGPYFISEDNMAFGWPTRYLQLDMDSVGGAENWDRAVYEANTKYKGRMHNLFCDNCHSHVAYALNEMGYKGSTSWNMYSVGCLIGFRGRFLGCLSFLRTFGPCLAIFSVLIAIFCLL